MNLMGISSVELVVIVVVVVLVLGPSGVAQAMQGLRRGVELARAWSARLRDETRTDELGLDDLDLSSLDLRQYDPREIVRQAVREEMDAWLTHAPTDRRPADPPQRPTGRRSPAGSERKNP